MVISNSKPEDIAEGVMKIAEKFTKNQPKITTIISAGLKSMKQTTY